MPRWFDAHLDLAYLAVHGRNMRLDARDVSTPHPPCAITLPSLAAGDVRLALGTIFTQPMNEAELAEARASGKASPESYPAGDADRAFIVGRAQLEAYLTWQDTGDLKLDLRAVLADEPGVGEITGGMGVSSATPFPIRTKIKRLPLKKPEGAPLHVGLLMESADPIKSPEHAAWWRERGLVAVGMSWVRGSRYATGNGCDPAANTIGLTDLGRALVPELDRLNIVHDLSHLSDRAVEDLFTATNKPVIASHSNCRAIIAREPLANTTAGSSAAPNLQRHLTDDTIREIVRRGGIIGLNLFTPFLVPGGRRDTRATLDQFIAHVEHVCTLAGDRAHVGLGSDADGGFAADKLIEGINSPTDYALICDALSDRRWSDDDIRGFACENWAAFFARVFSA